MTKVKLTVTIDAVLHEDLDRLAGEQELSRSRLVEKALLDWYRERRREALAEGYRAMSDENVEVAEDHLPAGLEVLE